MEDEAAGMYIPESAREINEQIFELWNKYFSGRDDVYAPVFINHYEPNGIAFIGMNPSFSARAFRTILKGTYFEGFDHENLFRWSNFSADRKNMQTCMLIDKYGLERYLGYFRRMMEIAKNVSLPWQHTDLFVYRLTSQHEFKEKILTNGELNEFAMEQLMIFERTLDVIQPKVIVVANAYASNIFASHFSSRLIFDETGGYHVLDMQGRRVPVFLTSMLSGQRALDTWSYKRLLWHIKKAVKDLESSA